MVRCVIYVTDKFERLKSLLADIKQINALWMIPTHLIVSVVWNPGLLAALGSRIIRQLRTEAQRLIGNAGVSYASSWWGSPCQLLKPFLH